VTAASGQGSTEIELVAVNENVAIEKLRGREASIVPAVSSSPFPDLSGLRRISAPTI